MSHFEKIPHHSPLQVMFDLYVQLFSLIVFEISLGEWRKLTFLEGLLIFRILYVVYMFYMSYFIFKTTMRGY